MIRTSTSRNSVALHCRARQRVLALFLGLLLCGAGCVSTPRAARQARQFEDSQRLEEALDVYLAGMPAPWAAEGADRLTDYVARDHLGAAVQMRERGRWYHAYAHLRAVEQMLRRAPRGATSLSRSDYQADLRFVKQKVVADLLKRTEAAAAKGEGELQRELAMIGASVAPEALWPDPGDMTRRLGVLPFRTPRYARYARQAGAVATDRLARSVEGAIAGSDLYGPAPTNWHERRDVARIDDLDKTTDMLRELSEKDRIVGVFGGAIFSIELHDTPRSEHEEERRFFNWETGKLDSRIVKVWTVKRRVTVSGAIECRSHALQFPRTYTFTAEREDVRQWDDDKPEQEPDAPPVLIEAALAGAPVWQRFGKLLARAVAQALPRLPSEVRLVDGRRDGNFLLKVAFQRRFARRP